MKKFNFKLQKLLDLREFYEKQAELDLANAIAEKDAIDLKLKTIANLKIEAGKKITSLLNVNDLHNTQYYIIRLDTERDMLLKEIVLAEEKVKEKRGLYIAGMSKRKVISKLQEKKLGIWKKENNKLQDEFIDNIVSFKYGSKIKNI